MRNKLFSVFAFFVVTVAYGQTTRFVYDTYVNPDSINLVTLKNELTFLDVKEGKSLFISERKLKRDSVQEGIQLAENKFHKKEDKKSGNRVAEPTFFEYFIKKDLSQKKTSYHEKLVDRELFYIEDRPIKWNIEEVKDKILGFEAQKATTYFGGRVWTAWFTKEILISDGPYKFYGLPGLIIKLEDDKGDYKFELLKKLTLNNVFEEKLSSKIKESSRLEFNGNRLSMMAELYREKKLDGMHGKSMPNGRFRRGMDANNLPGSRGMNAMNSGMPGEIGNPLGNILGESPTQGGSVSTSYQKGGVQNPIELN